MDNFKQKPVTLSTMKEITESSKFEFMSEILDTLAAEAARG